MGGKPIPTEGGKCIWLWLRYGVASVLGKNTESFYICSQHTLLEIVQNSADSMIYTTKKKGWKAEIWEKTNKPHCTNSDLAYLTPILENKAIHSQLHIRS